MHNPGVVDEKNSTTRCNSTTSMAITMNLENIGWNNDRATHFVSIDTEGATPGRLLRAYRRRYDVQTAEGVLDCEVTGAFRHEHPRLEDFPAVGDWVAVVPVPGEEKGRIHHVLPRQSSFRRVVPGRTSEIQVLAANVDTVFLVSGLDGDFKVRRIERYLTMAYESGATPIIVLNKCDLEPDLDSRIQAVEGVAFGVPIHAVSSLSGKGIDELKEYVIAGKTVVCLGSSGAGKSSLVNALMGNAVMDTGAVRDGDSRGRHTTTHRELFQTPGGGMIIDTPGIRELQVAGDSEHIDSAFEEVEAVLRGCQFRDCTHEGEPGCAVDAALEAGTLDPARYEAYLKLRREMAYAERRSSENFVHEERKRGKEFGKMCKRVMNEKKNRR
jgi:ribosome biogenesis GTPase / thiamine phosphate phosphatase